MSQNNPMVQVIMQNQKALRTVIPSHLSPDRMCRLALVTTQRNPNLLKCTPASLLGALLTATQLGLEPGVSGMGEIIPYYNKNKKAWEAQFLPGYRGLMALARRSGEVGAINAEIVHTNDTFQYELGSEPYIKHVPAPGDRGEVTHVYATARLVSTNERQFVVMTKADVEQVRSVAREGGFSPWQTHWDEMAKKTAIRRLCKLLPTSVETQRAVSLEERLEAGVSQQNDAELPFDLDLKIDPEPVEEAADGKVE